MDMTLMDRLRPIGFTPAVAQAMVYWARGEAWHADAT